MRPEGLRGGGEQPRRPLATASTSDLADISVSSLTHLQLENCVGRQGDKNSQTWEERLQGREEKKQFSDN